MSAIAFDTLKLARKLRDTAHMPAEQAEGIADALAEAMSGAELATKADVTITVDSAKAELKADIGALKADLKADIAVLSERVERRCAETDARLIRWVVGTGVAAFLALGGTVIGATLTIIRSLPH
ncbi:MAG: hypothetical protein WCF85_03040 [Rhodospirillaceae bacterium]